MKIAHGIKAGKDAFSFTLVLLLSANFSFVKASKLTDCDLLAADPFDISKIASGVNWDAIKACNEAF